MSQTKTCNKDTLYNALDKIKELEKELKIANEGLTIAYMHGVEDGKKKLHEKLNKYRWRDAINEPPEHEDSIVLLSIGYEEIGSYCLHTETYYINGEPMPCGDVSHWTEFAEFEELDK